MPAPDPRVRIAKLGRYEGADAVAPPANRVLIGRETQRAKFFNLLFTQARRGAYLVTGHRGSGKTSFVEHCVSSYKDDVLGRFLRSDVGRSYFWDRIALVLFAIFVMAALLVLKGVLHFVLEVWNTGAHHWLRIVVAIPIVGILGYPILVAKDLLGQAFSPSFERSRSESGWKKVLLFVREHALPWALVILPAAALSLWPIGIRHLVVQPERGAWTAIALVGVVSGAVNLPTLLRGAAGQIAIKETLKALFLIALVVAFGALIACSWSAKIWLSDIRLKRALLAVGIENFPRAHIAPWAALLIAIVLWGLTLGRSVGDEYRMKLVLSAKAFAFILLGVQLLRPAILFLYQAALHLLVPGSDHMTEVDGIASEIIKTTPHAWRVSEVSWLVLAVILLLMIAKLEYDWILLPYKRAIDGIPLDKGAERDQEQQRWLRETAEKTFFWFIYRSWLPVLRVSVSLGVDTLDHRRVIEAMLLGLRDEYEREFSDWRSPFANIMRVARLGIILFMTTLAGDHLFSKSQQRAREDGDDLKCACTPIADAIETGCKETAPRAWTSKPISLKFLEGLKVGQLTLADIAEIDIFDHPALDAEHSHPKVRLDRYGCRKRLSDFMLPTEYEGPEQQENLGQQADKQRDTSSSAKNQGKGDYEHHIVFKVYHLVLFVLFYFLTGWLSRRWPILPYRQTRLRIRRAIDSLSSRLREETRTRGQLDKVVQVLSLGGESATSKDTDPLDPRTVELAFLKLLRDIQDTAMRPPFSASAVLHLPSPDIIFIFDELDKVGAPQIKPSSGEGSLPEAWDEERERSRKLHALFSDLKNVLSSAPARFIFVGGRNLHDEWLADQTSRQPLLTRMFNDEIYLPSFLTDESAAKLAPKQQQNQEKSKPEDGVRAFLLAQRWRARELRETWKSTREQAWLGIDYEPRLAPTFAVVLEDVKLEFEPCAAQSSSQGSSQSGSQMLDAIFEAIMETILGETLEVSPQGSNVSTALQERFIEFLTYRSMGNAKRLTELIEGFVHPYETDGNSSSQNHVDHVIRLTDEDRHRVELVSAIYRFLYQTFVDSTIWKDDKLAPAVFYLMDFLLKFHGRAFSRSSLEHVDELVHIHRAPELRPVLHAIVSALNGPILHPIRNGMYVYRFRSDIAEELRAASRGSEEERAALNFTLDESQTLKSFYSHQIANSEKPIAHELETTLGELHDFDEELDLARYHYRNAVRLMDEHLQRDVFSGAPPADKDTAQWSALYRVIGNQKTGAEVLKARIHWGIARLRVMLQLGMTHERTKDYESAIFTYRNARTLADAMINAFAEEIATRAPVVTADGAIILGQHKQEEKPVYIALIKHLNLLFQPIFAEAWAVEKSGAGVDTGPALIELELARLRKKLPFVNELFGRRLSAESAVDIQHSNFALTMAELHDKAGDIYFFKGQQPKQEDSEQRPCGYLRRAHYHYAVSLHEIRSYNIYRRKSARAKLGPASVGIEPLAGKSLPDFVTQIAAGSLCDLAETILAELSMKKLMEPGPNGRTTQEKIAEIIKSDVSKVEEWLNSDKVDLPGGLENWLGKQPLVGGGDLLDVSPTGEEKERIFVYTVLTMTAARLLAKDGRLGDAAREALLVAETIARVFWWRSVWINVKQETVLNIATDLFWVSLGYIGDEALGRAKRWWSAAQRDKPADNGFFQAFKKQVEGSLELARKGKKAKDKEINNFEDGLKENSYPLLHRLYGLKALIEHALVHEVNASKSNEWIRDFIELKRRYRAPLQFTYLDAGTTLALAAIKEHNPEKKEHLRRLARDRLKMSEQCTTMRRAYYEMISDMYYLYDDFNDRRVHHNQALQMAGADLRDLLLEKLEKP